MAFFDAQDWDGKLFSGGWTEGGAGKQAAFAPATGSEIGSIGLASIADVGRAATAAAAAQQDWAAASYEVRAGVLRRAATVVEQNAAVLAEWIARESGSTAAKAQFETYLVTGEFHSGAALTEAPYGQLLRSNKPRLSLARRLPVGVVGVIAPFNFPAILAMRSVAPALALGNAVILKPDTRTAICGGLVLAAILQEAGLPEGLFHVLPGGADIGSAVVVEPAVRVISFTGSTEAGRAVGELAAHHLKRAHLELGGNNAVVVLDDVDVAAAASAGAWGSFLHQGQICMTTGRHLVQDAIYDEYVERLSASANGLPVSADPAAAIGPLIDARQRDRVHSLVTASVQAGARLAAGGTYEGLFYRPTVLADSAATHPAFANEVFGPVAPVLRFSTLEEAVAVANQTEFGLSLGILTRDALRGLKLAEGIRSGIVHINDQTVDDEPVIPFGGVGASGTGARFGGADANIAAFTETQWVTMQTEIERYPF